MGNGAWFSSGYWGRDTAAKRRPLCPPPLPRVEIFPQPTSSDPAFAFGLTPRPPPPPWPHPQAQTSPHPDHTHRLRPHPTHGLRGFPPIPPRSHPQAQSPFPPSSDFHPLCPTSRASSGPVPRPDPTDRLRPHPTPPRAQTAPTPPTHPTPIERTTSDPALPSLWPRPQAAHQAPVPGLPGFAGSRLPFTRAPPHKARPRLLAHYFGGRRVP